MPNSPPLKQLTLCMKFHPNYHVYLALSASAHVCLRKLVRKMKIKFIVLIYSTSIDIAAKTCVDKCKFIYLFMKN